jgi:quinol monooxygenase YgiN
VYMLRTPMIWLIYLFLSTVVPGAQAPGDTAAYAVGYVDVMPSARPAAIAALKQYRDASRKDKGYVRIEFFEQAGRPGHLNIIETFANQEALDGHAADSHTKQFRSKLDSIRLSDYDQRPYKTLTLGPLPSGANAPAIYVITHVDIGGQGTNAPELLQRLAETSRKEPGNLRFDVLQHSMRANHFTVIEAWQSQKALDTHAEAAHTKEYRDGLAPIAGSPLDERIYKVIE